MIVTEKREIKWVFLGVVSAVVFAVTLAALLIHLLPQGNEVESVISHPPVSSDPLVELPDNPKNFAELQALNPDVCGWITVPGTAVDYPILQSSDQPEDFYLDHDINKKYRFSGAIYIQKVNFKDFSDPNTVIYGHNMLNGTMMGTLKRFRNKAFFDEHEYFYIYIPGHILTYRIFSAFVYDDRHLLYSFDFYSEEGYSAFLKQALNPVSMVKNVREGVSVTTSDRIVTLSTCTANKKERYLVEGVLINDQPTK